MGKYIPLDSVVMEINRQIELLKPFLGACAGQILAEANAKLSVLEGLKNFLETLEVKEMGVDLGDPKGDKSAKYIIDTKKLEVKEVANTPNIRFPHYKSIVEKVFGAGNLESFEYDEAEQLVSLAKEELLKDLEVKEVDLEKEYKDFIKSDNGRSMFETAKHFFDLGLNASNPITAEDRGTAEEIIVNLKRVEQDYRINLTKEMEWVRNQVKKGELSHDR